MQCACKMTVLTGVHKRDSTPDNHPMALGPQAISNQGKKESFRLARLNTIR
jgi:hypothetical protein